MISIIILNMGNTAYIRRCVYAVTHQTYKETEIFYISDGIDESMKKWLSEQGVISSCALREVIEKTHGEYLFFCDVSFMPAPDLLETLYAVGEKKESLLPVTKSLCLTEGSSESDFGATIFGKLFRKDLFAGQIPCTENGSFYDNFLCVLRYLQHMETVEPVENTYIYQSDSARLFENTFIENWETIFPLMASLDDRSSRYILRSLKNNLDKENVYSYAEMVLAEKYCHSNYELNYWISSAVLPSMWESIKGHSDNECYGPFRDYLQKYEQEPLFLKILLKCCGLKAEDYEYLKDNNIDHALFFIAEDTEDDSNIPETDIMEKIELIQKDISILQKKMESTEKKEQKKEIGTLDAGIDAQQVINAYAQGKMGLRYLFRFFGAWLKYKVKR